MKSKHISLGINLSHDASAAVCMDGKPVIAIASERLCRLKHGFPPVKRYHLELPWDAICYCLDAAGVGIDDCHRIVLNKAGGDWDWSLENLKKTIPVLDKDKIVCLATHHYAHALFSYLSSGLEECLVLVADRFGSFIPGLGIESETGYIVNNGRFKKLFSNTVALPATPFGNFVTEHSLTALYQAVTLHYGFFNGMDECGKTMGLAAYGKKLFPEQHWIKLKEDFSLDCSNFYEFLTAKGIIETGEIEPVSFSVQNIARVRRKDYRKVSPDIACQAQFEVEETVKQIINRMVESNGLRTLCLCGGLFHNSVLNSKLLVLPSIQNLFVPLAPSDDGNAIGCAYYGCLLDSVPCQPLPGAFLGRNYSVEEMEGSLKSFSLIYEKPAQNILLNKTVTALEKGDVVGWFQGGSEFGFRALGHRSILADPRDPGIRDFINHYVKYREKFRPLGAMVLEEQASEWFGLSQPSPYMNLVASSLRGSVVPAVTHVDGTSRVQTVNRNDGITYKLLQEFYRRTGVPLLLNTSFNVKGEPIIETPTEAVRGLITMNIDTLVMGPCLVFKGEKNKTW